MIDGNEADDKIIAVLRNDTVYGHFTDIEEVPKIVIQRLEHYFLTYKDMPGPNAFWACLAISTPSFCQAEKLMSVLAAK